MNPPQDLLDQLKIEVGAVWTDCVGNIWQEDIIERKAWGQCTLPIAVIVFDEATVDPSWGTDVNRYSVVISFYYVAQTDNAPANAIRQKIYDFSERIKTIWQDLKTGTLHGNMIPLEVKALKWGSSCTVNSILTQKNLSQAAGQIDIEFLIEE